MAGEYNASAKFDSTQAERGINSLAGKIDGLKTKLQGVSGAGKQFDSTWAAANRTMSTSVAKARQMETSLASVNRGAKAASASIRGFAGSLNTGEMARAAGIIRSLGTHLTTTSGRMRQIRQHSAGMTTSLTGMSRMAVSAALGIERLGNALLRAIPRMMQGASAAKSLAASLGFINKSYAMNITGLGQIATASRRAQTAQSSLNNTQARGRVVANQYSAALTGVNGSLLSLGSGLAGVRNLGMAWLAGMGVSGLANMADTAKLTAARLSLVTDSMLELTALQGELMRSSNETRTGFRDNVNLFTKMAQAGEQYGLSLQKTLTITENVQKAFKISGATTSEAQAASQQLAQGFASGRLQGDELRSILENAPRLGRALSEHLNIPLGEIRKRAKEGEIGIRELVKAFGNTEVTRELAEEFAKIPVTISDAITVAGNKLLEFVGSVDKAGGISSKVAGVIMAVANNFQFIGSAAVFAGTMIMASYVPSIIQAVRASRTFLALKWAAYGAGVVGAFSNMAGGVGLFRGALTRSANSTLPMWRQVVGNVVGASVLNVQAMGKGFASVFMRMPAIFAIGSIALYAFNDDTKIVQGELATTQDYMVTGFQAAWTTIANIVSSVSGFITRKINETIDNMIWGVDQLYRLGKIAGGVAIGVGKVTMSLAPGGVRPQDAVKSLSDQTLLGYGKTGIREDIGNVLKGSQWSKRANARAMERFANDLGQSPSWQAYVLSLQAGDDTLTEAPPGGDGKKDRIKKPRKPRQKKDRTAEEMKRVRAELDRLNASFSEAEEKRQEFNDGLKTLNEAFKFNMINADQLNDKLRRLAHETFPGLRDELKALQTENKDLIIRAKGGTDADVDIAHAKDTVQAQIDQIDTIISRQGDVGGILEAQKTTLRDQLSTYTQMRSENEELIKLADEREAKEQEIMRLMEDGWMRMTDLFVEYTRRSLGAGRLSFKDFFSDVLDMARDMFAELLNLNVFQPMREKMMGFMSGIFKGPKSPSSIGSQAIGDALGGATGSYKDLRDEIPTIKLDINGSSQTASTSGDTVNVNVDPSTGLAEPQGEDITVTASRLPKNEGFFPAMMRGYKESWNGTLKDLGKLFKPIGDLMKKAGEKLGVSSETMAKVGEKVGKGFAGAQKGMMIADLGRSLGMKTSRTGGAIGGALGSLLPIPGGDIIGGIVGSIIGGMFKKAKRASISVSTGANGRFEDNKATGNSREFREAVNAVSDSVKSGIYQLAETLGGEVAGNFNLGTIDMKTKKSGGFLGIGGKTKTYYTFNGQKYDTEGEAIEAMIKAAISGGIIKGLSATSDRVLRTMQDTDRAIQIVQTIESIKKQADAIRNPTKKMFEDLKKDLESTLKLFKEAGASSEDYADLSVVAQQRFKDIVDASLKELQDFRFDLTGGNLSYLTPADRLAAASTKFATMEADIAAGRAVDPSLFTSEANNLIGLARDVFGSTPEFAAYQARVLAATDAMIASAQAQVDAYQPIIDAILNQTDQVVDIGNRTNEILEEIASGGGFGGGGGGGGFRGGSPFDMNSF